jgi:hypothetical protein
MKEGIEGRLESHATLPTLPLVPPFIREGSPTASKEFNL